MALFKIKYSTLAIMEDGTVGNVNQGDYTCYVECKFRKVHNKLEKFLKNKNKVPIINEVLIIPGFILK